MAQKALNPLKKKINVKTSSAHNRPAATNVKKQDVGMRAMATSVGDFIRYWGFRRIHGQLWTQIYLSKEALSGSELVKSLSVSKALVSPALSELIQFDLISATETDGRTKKYVANPEVFEVIRSILRQREKKLIETAQSNYENLQKYENSGDSKKSNVNPDRLRALGEMISAASFALDVVIKSSENDPLSS